MRKGLVSLAILVLLIVTGIPGIGCVPEMESPGGAPPAADTPDTESPEEGAAPPATEAPDAGLPVTGIIEVRVTDAPPREQVTSILVTVSNVRIHKAVAEQEREQEHQGSDNVTQEQEQEREQQQERQGEGAWLSLNGDEAKSFDLIEIKGLEEILTVGKVAVGRYTQIRMTIETVEVTIGDGEPREATVPSGELRFTRPFDVMEDDTTVLLFDFDADRMVTVSGSGKVTVKPVVTLAIRQGKSHHQN